MLQFYSCHTQTIGRTMVMTLKNFAQFFNCAIHGNDLLNTEARGLLELLHFMILLRWVLSVLLFFPFFVLLFDAFQLFGDQPFALYTSSVVLALGFATFLLLTDVLIVRIDFLNHKLMRRYAFIAFTVAGKLTIELAIDGSLIALPIGAGGFNQLDLFGVHSAANATLIIVFIITLLDLLCIKMIFICKIFSTSMALYFSAALQASYARYQQGKLNKYLDFGVWFSKKSPITDPLIYRMDVYCAVQQVTN